MCRETLNGIVALSIQVAKYRAYSEHIREPKATAPHQDPMPRLQWKDMKWSFIRYARHRVLVGCGRGAHDARVLFITLWTEKLTSCAVVSPD